jgi:hypothetical protein
MRRKRYQSETTLQQKVQTAGKHKVVVLLLELLVGGRKLYYGKESHETLFNADGIDATYAPTGSIKRYYYLQNFNGPFELEKLMFLIGPSQRRVRHNVRGSTDNEECGLGLRLDSNQPWLHWKANTKTPAMISAGTLTIKMRWLFNVPHFGRKPFKFPPPQVLVLNESIHPSITRQSKSAMQLLRWRIPTRLLKMSLLKMNVAVSRRMVCVAVK